MGLFKKKVKEGEYDREESEIKKKRMREIFDKVVDYGDSYEILYAYMTTSKVSKRLLFDTNTTIFYYYIVGYRLSDFALILVQVDKNLEEFSGAYHVETEKIVNVSYTPKIQQLSFIYEKGYDEYGEILNIGSTSKKTIYGPKNIYQPEEGDKFLDFAEAFRENLSSRGFKLGKWKR